MQSQNWLIQKTKMASIVLYQLDVPSNIWVFSITIVFRTVEASTTYIEVDGSFHGSSGIGIFHENGNRKRSWKLWNLS